LSAACQQVQALLDREVACGVPTARAVLLGFSQGCAMTLMAELRPSFNRSCVQSMDQTWLIH